MLDSAPRIWDDGASGAWSLLSVLRIMAANYVDMGKVFQYWATRLLERDFLSEEDFEFYRNTLSTLLNQSEEADLSTSHVLIGDALSEAAERGGRMLVEHAARKIQELERCVEAELRLKLFFFVPSHRAQYLVVFSDMATKKSDEMSLVGQEVSKFHPVMNTFPKIIFDLEEAGQCFAVGAFTASVFHLMRVCEHGLVSLARSLEIDPGIADWGTLLRLMAKRVEEYNNNKPDGWLANKEFYSETINLMYAIKNSWRNSVSHIRKTYDEPRARRIFNSVEALMVHLSSRLTPAPLPEDSLLTDPDREISEAAGNQNSAIPSKR